MVISCLSIMIGHSSVSIFMLLVVVGTSITEKQKQLKTERTKQKFFKQNRRQLLQQW